MQIREDNTQLFDENGKPVLSLRMEIELHPDNPLKQKDWLINKIKGNTNTYIHIQDIVDKQEEEEVKKEIPEYKKCPITGIDIDGVISSKGAVLFGVITEEDRLIMRSKDSRGSVKIGGKSKSKTLENPEKYIDYNESYCTARYKKTIEGVERVHGIVTVIL